MSAQGGEGYAGARRVLRVLKAMRGHTFDGVANSDLAKSLGESPSNITRALQVLVDEGLAMKLDNGRYAHSVALLQIAQAYATETVRLQARINETAQRISAGI